MWLAASALPVSHPDRAELTRWSRASTTEQRLAFRARLLLLAAAGRSNAAIARELSCTRPTVIKWRARYQEQGLAGVREDAPRSGRPRTITAEQERAVVEATLHTTPPDATHWSSRTLAAAQGLGRTAVQAIWRAYGLQPHRVETFKLSTDPQFADKLRDVVGLYLAPPDRALVISVDEKSQIQALERTRPVEPLGPGQPERQTHDYRRHGTTTLFAALDVATGKIIGECLPRHRHGEFLQFLKTVDRRTRKDYDLHLIVDNYGPHKHPKVQEWLGAHPRFHLHFTPTSASWLNLVERFFAEITRKRIRRGSFTSVGELTRAIQDYLQQHNRRPKPFIWTARADDILSKVLRCQRNSRSAH